MSVKLTVTETIFHRPPIVEEFEGTTRQAAIAGYLKDGNYRDWFEPAALISLLSKHDDLRLGGPTWDIRFAQTFEPE